MGRRVAGLTLLLALLSWTGSAAFPPPFFARRPAGGVITHTLLTAQTSSTDVAVGNSYVTASVNAAANRLILLAIAEAHGTGTDNVPTVTGLSATWVHIASESSIDNGNHTLHLFRTMLASPASGTITITVPSGTGWFAAGWAVSEFGGVNTSGTQGSGAIVQSVVATLQGGGANTTLTVTLNAFAQATNRTYLLAGLRLRSSPGDPVTPGTNFTELVDAFIEGSDQYFVAWAATTNDNTADFSWTIADDDVSAIAVEIAAAP